MGFYDAYLQRITDAPTWLKTIRSKALDRLITWIDRSCGGEKNRTVLEIGIGDGSFRRKAQQHGWSYTGLDRNPVIANPSDGGKVLCAEVPPFPPEISQARFDLIYASFVLEHMENGKTACEFMRGAASCLADDGSLIILVPDALSLKMEFWSVDYTHSFPATERNVKQIADDCGLRCREVIRYRCAFSENRLVFHVLRFMSWFYNYRFFKSVFGHEWLFYGIYQHLNQDLLAFAFQKKEER